MNLESRSWNGTAISRRTTDGFVNATAMCKANGKLWADYFRTDRATKYLEALSAKTGNPILGSEGLVISSVGGNHSGTWIHPQVSVDLARWISPEFAVWMDDWFIQQFDGRVSQVRDTQLPAPDVLETVDRAMGLLERLGGVDERAQMLLRDVVLNHTMKAAGGSAPMLEAAKELTLSEKLIEMGCPTHKATPLATRIGREVKKVYRNQNGRDPKSQDQLVNGRRCAVAVYEIDWLASHEEDLRDAINTFLAG